MIDGLHVKDYVNTEHSDGAHDVGCEMHELFQLRVRGWQSASSGIHA
jgi:hypothetical protein